MNSITQRAFERRMGVRRRARGCGAVAGPAQWLATLRGATGLVAMFYPEQASSVTKDGSNNVDALAPIVGTASLTETSTNRPVWGATSPTGRRGITFTAASSQRLKESSSALAAIIDGSQAYSSLWVAKQASAGATAALWSAGSSSTTDSIYEGVVSTGGERHRRFQTAATQNDGSALGTSIAMVSAVYTGSAYSSWLNGTASLVAAANVRAPTCDMFSIGCQVSATPAGHWGGDFWLLMLSTSQWSTAERQRYESAARALLGTP